LREEIEYIPTQSLYDVDPVTPNALTSAAYLTKSINVKSDEIEDDTKTSSREDGLPI